MFKALILGALEGLASVDLPVTLTIMSGALKPPIPAYVPSKLKNAVQHG